MSKAEPMTSEQVEELRRAYGDYREAAEQLQMPRITQDELTQRRIRLVRARNHYEAVAAISMPAILASLDHREAMLRRMDKHAPAGGEREIIYFNRPI